MRFNGSQLFSCQLIMEIDSASRKSFLSPLYMCPGWLLKTVFSFHINSRMLSQKLVHRRCIHFLLFLSLKLNPDSHLLVIYFRIHDFKNSSLCKSQYWNPLWGNNSLNTFCLLELDWSLLLYSDQIFQLSSSYPHPIYFPSWCYFFLSNPAEIAKLPHSFKAGTSLWFVCFFLCPKIHPHQNRKIPLK